MCWEVRHTDILILLRAGSILPYGSKEGWLDLPLPPAEKSNAFPPEDLGPSYITRARPLSPSHMSLHALFLATIMRVP